jgi:hypothetical protein
MPTSSTETNINRCKDKLFLRNTSVRLHYLTEIYKGMITPQKHEYILGEGVSYIYIIKRV